MDGHRVMAPSHPRAAARLLTGVLPYPVGVSSGAPGIAQGAPHRRPIDWSLGSGFEHDGERRRSRPAEARQAAHADLASPPARIACHAVRPILARRPRVAGGGATTFSYYATATVEINEIRREFERLRGTSWNGVEPYAREHGANVVWPQRSPNDPPCPVHNQPDTDRFEGPVDAHRVLLGEGVNASR